MLAPGAHEFPDSGFFGVREAAFTLYFSRLRLPIESALLVSLVPTALVMLFSLSGAAVYVGRRR